MQGLQDIRVLAIYSQKVTRDLMIEKQESYHLKHQKKRMIDVPSQSLPRSQLVSRMGDPVLSKTFLLRRMDLQLSWRMLMARVDMAIEKYHKEKIAWHLAGMANCESDHLWEILSVFSLSAGKLSVVILFLMMSAR